MLLAALRDTPVVLLQGPRQAGKSTLAKWIAEGPHPARYVTLDHLGTLAVARSDPQGFVGGFEAPVVLDEVQRAPEIFLPLKAEVDRHRRPGRFLLTGSADVMLLPRLSESLAGRMETIRLWPLSQSEIETVRDNFVDRLFGRSPGVWQGVKDEKKEAVERLVRGGYPEAVKRSSEGRRRRWFDSLVGALLERDVRDLAQIEGLTDMPRLLAFLAARPASTLNLADASRGIGIPHSTLRRYMTLLERIFLVVLVEPWFINVRKRLVKSPKVFLADTGLASHLAGLGVRGIRDNPIALGGILENFVAMEIRKEIEWSRAQPRLYHLREHAGEEVDLVLEDRSGRLVGVEVKAASTLTARDFRGLRYLDEKAGKKFIRGVVLYTGRETVPFGRRLLAMPLSSIWRDGD